MIRALTIALMGVLLAWAAPALAGEDQETGTASEGAEIPADTHGRVKVQFPNLADQDGDPDRPVIAGTVPNPPGAGQGFSKEAKAMLSQYFGIEDAVPDQYDQRVDKAHGKGKGGKKSSLPPGLAKRDELPPGLAKMETLPPGLASRDLPPGLLGDLAPLPRGTKARIVDDDRVVLIEEASGKVLDILPGKIPSTFDEAKAEKDFKARRDKTTKGSKIDEN